jgi:DNA invertase Pin-like site-specific DNA recombinase
MKKNRGKPIKIRTVRRAQAYLAKGLKESEVARILKTTRQQVNRWTHYIAAGKIPPLPHVDK